MGDYLLSPKAQGDVNEIWDWTAARWGIGQAERYVRDIQAALKGLADHPESGRPCDHLRAGYRRQEVASHVVFYRRRGHDIDVVRILHVRRNVRRHL